MQAKGVDCNTWRKQAQTITLSKMPATPHMLPAMVRKSALLAVGAGILYTLVSPDLLGSPCSTCNNKQVHGALACTSGDPDRDFTAPTDLAHLRWSHVRGHFDNALLWILIWALIAPYQRCAAIDRQQSPSLGGRMGSIFHGQRNRGRSLKKQNVYQIWACLENARRVPQQFLNWLPCQTWTDSMLHFTCKIYMGHFAFAP